MIYTIADLRAKVQLVADRYDIQEILLFGSYYDGEPTAQSDVDLLIKYGPGCRGLTRIRFMNDLEECLGKPVDAINIDYAPSFVRTFNLKEEGRIVYGKETNHVS